MPQILRRSAFRRLLLSRTPATEPAQGIVEDRRKEDAKQRDAQHAGEDGRSQRLPHFGPGACANHQR